MKLRKISCSSGVLMDNSQIAQFFYKISEYLEMSDENPFKIRAYEKAAKTIEGLPYQLADINSEKELREIPGIGESIAEKILEIKHTRKSKFLDELAKKFPPELLDIMSIPGMGPKKALFLYKEMNIKNVDTLEKYAQRGKLRNLHGFGAKTEENILRGIVLKRQYKGRLPLKTALSQALNIISQMKNKANISLISEAGSLRRRKETIGDIDILAGSNKPQVIIDVFVKLPMVKDIIAKGETKASIITVENLQVDLRVVKIDSFGAALQYFTGSKEHNIKLRSLAENLGYKINEYGIFKTKNNKKAGGEKEEDIYKVLNLPFIPPVIRETGEEIEAAQKNKLPDLIELKDIKGDLHFHSNWSDGVDSLERIAQKAKEFGYKYLAVTDHSQSLKVAHGLTLEQILKHTSEIKNINKNNSEFKLLAGAEVDVLPTGELDYPDEILKKLDIVVASVHSHFGQDKSTMTKRICKAMENPNVDIIAHPSGRLLGERDEYAVDWDFVFKTAFKTSTALEINAFPDRLDLRDIYCKRAKEFKVVFTISTDSHQVKHMSLIEYGIWVAQRGWVEKKDVLNARPLEQLFEWLKR